MRIFYALDEARAFKDEYEIELMRHAAKITDNCHLAVMSALPIETKETHIHAEFMYHALRQGAKTNLMIRYVVVVNLVPLCTGLRMMGI